MATTLKYKLVKTRKRHLCFSCLRRFEPNVKMYYWFCVYSGQSNSGYTCKMCHEIINLLHVPGDEDIIEGYVKEMLNEGETPETLLNDIIKSKLK